MIFGLKTLLLLRYRPCDSVWQPVSVSPILLARSWFLWLQSL